MVQFDAATGTDGQMIRCATERKELWVRLPLRSTRFGMPCRLLHDLGWPRVPVSAGTEIVGMSIRFSGIFAENGKGHNFFPRFPYQLTDPSFSGILPFFTAAGCRDSSCLLLLFLFDSDSFYAFGFCLSLG